jgi:hypothetical protein
VEWRRRLGVTVWASCKLCRRAYRPAASRAAPAHAPRPATPRPPRDDVAGHERWAAHFGAARVIHEGEATARQGTDKAEVKLAGQGPWALPDGGDDAQIVHTPGHTAHHLCLLSRPHRALFAGDHLSAHEGPGGVEEGRLAASRAFNWYSWDEQVGGEGVPAGAHAGAPGRSKRGRARERAPPASLPWPAHARCAARPCLSTPSCRSYLSPRPSTP